MRSFMFDILQGDMTRSKVILTFTCLKMYIARSGDTSGSRTTLFISIKCCPPGFSIFGSNQFSRGCYGKSPYPQGSRSSPSNLQRDSRVDSKTSHRPSRRFSVSLLFSYFCDSQEIRGSSCNFFDLKIILVFISVSFSEWKLSMSFYRICAIKTGQSR